MTTYGMVIEVDRCTGCYLCFLACRDEHVGNDHKPVSLAQPETGHRWIDLREHERGALPRVKVDYVAVPCLQCADAPCLAAARGAAWRRPDGIVVIDPDRAAGRRDLVAACPYGAVFWNEAANIPQKCSFCAHLIDDGWREPRCVEACPTQAIVFGDLADPGSAIARLRATRPVEELRPDLATRPAVVYLGLPKRFVTGEIVFADKTQLPAESVTVELEHGGERHTTQTDNYGDFEFDGLDAGAACTLRVAHPGYAARTLPLSSRADLDVGTIMLDPLPAKTP
jgi:Fe-S-cluster-containing dehydrogenase component